jgi:signal transduction histidine kinase
LLQLINNVLDLAKIESGKTELLVEPFSLSEVMTGVINTLESIAAKKEVTIRLELSTTLPVVRIDKNKFRQILYNLLSNAIKFNRDRGEVKISAMPHGDDTFMVRVTDTGIGITKENLKKLFIPFVQLDSGVARQHEGSGLGLALTKNIVELHRGQIGVDSEPGTGTTFWIIMPLHITLT